MLVTIYLTVVFLSLLVLHVSSRYSKAGRMIDKIPGPTPLPLIGSALKFNVSLEKLWIVILETVDEYYPLVRIWLGQGYGVFIRHPDDMKALLSCKMNIRKAISVYGSFRSINNRGLITGRGEKWRQRRKMINPAFNPNLMKVYTEIMNEHAVHLIKDLTNNNIEIIPNAFTIFLKLALGVICETTMGVDPKDYGVKKENEFRESFNIISETAYYRASRPYIKNWMMKFLSVGRRQERALKGMRDFTSKIIQERREYHERIGFQKYESIGDDVENVSSTDQTKRLSILDLLLAAEKEKLIDNWGIMEEVETFIIAGYETSGVAMTFALLLLAEHKDAQELARAEVTQRLKETNGELTVADVNKLEYLDRCIKETLRLYPSAPFAGRSITHDIKLGNYELPRKTEAVMHFFSLHRDPNFWPNPEKFDPDRFLPENTKVRHPFAFLPFSAGPRACIGQKFAMLQVKVTIARILYNFYVEPINLASDAIFKMHVTLQTKNPLSIKLTKIDGESTV